MRQYEVIEYSDCMWVRRIGEDRPSVYFEGTGEREIYLANRAATLLGIKLSHERNRRYGRGQKQMELVMALPGLKVWTNE